MAATPKRQREDRNTLQYVFAFDFESFGGVTSDHGFTQLGAALICLDTGVIIEEFNEYTNMSGCVAEERCLTEFWLQKENVDRYWETVTKVKNSESTPAEVISHYIKWMKKCVEFHSIENVYLITDNSPYDAAILRYYAKEDIMYLFGKYRDIVDISCFYTGMSMTAPTMTTFESSSKEFALSALNEKKKRSSKASEETVVFLDNKEIKMLELKLPPLSVQHDHDAVNDAETMGLYWAFFYQVLKTLE